jgi:sugar O-acyltransferase (sialic acid O-acetyltransferase NeuD family)
MNPPVIVIGAGGYAKIVADALLAIGYEILGFTDTDPAKRGSTVLGRPVIGDDDTISQHEAISVLLANGIGSTHSLQLRRDTYLRFIDRGYRFATFAHPKATVATSARLGAGVQILAGAVVQAGASIGDNSIINIGALIDHDCVIGQHCHIAPGCVLSGGIVIGDQSHVGTGASIRQGIKLGRQTIVGVGAAVVSNFDGGGTLIGVPAKPAK